MWLLVISKCTLNAHSHCTLNTLAIHSQCSPHGRPGGKPNGDLTLPAECLSSSHYNRIQAIWFISFTLLTALITQPWKRALFIRKICWLRKYGKTWQVLKWQAERKFIFFLEKNFEVENCSMLNRNLEGFPQKFCCSFKVFRWEFLARTCEKLKRHKEAL